MPGYVTLAVPRGGAADRRDAALEPSRRFDWAGIDDASCPRRSERARRARAWSRPERRGARARRAAAGGARRPDRARRRRALRARAGRAAATRRPHAARGRARAAARGRDGLGRRAPARSGAPCRRPLRLRLPAQGSGHARRIARPGRARLRPAPPALATAGTGDVLTGVIAAFLAKGLDAARAAAAAPRRTGLRQPQRRITQGWSRATSSPRCRRRWGSLGRVQVEILGSGGAATIPRPGCRLPRLRRGPREGRPFARTGPSTFVHGPNILFDTPEESKLQLERAGIGEIAACFYSHWHPDHTMGRRVWETRNGDFRTWPREAKRPLVTDVYLPEQVAPDFRSGSAGWPTSSSCRPRLDPDPRARGRRDGRDRRCHGAPLPARRGLRLRLRAHRRRPAAPRRDGRAQRLVAAACGDGLRPGGAPDGHLRVRPVHRRAPIHEDHPVLRFEATFEETLGDRRRARRGRVVLSHVEEMDCISYDDLLRVEQRLQAEGRTSGSPGTA